MKRMNYLEFSRGIFSQTSKWRGRERYQGQRSYYDFVRGWPGKELIENRQLIAHLVIDWFEKESAMCDLFELEIPSTPFGNRDG